jgi:protein-export SecD/SecF family membrane protein
MDLKRLFTFLLIVTVTFAVIVVAGWYSPNFNIKDHTKLGLDLKGGFEILYEASPIIEGKEVDRESLVQTAHSLEKRINAYGVAEPEVLIEGDRRIRVRIAGVTDEGKLREVLRSPAELTFRSADGTKEMIGTDFVERGAKLDYDPNTQEPIISIEVKDPDKFAEITKRLLNQPLAIYLDERELSAPVIRAVISNGKAVISGGYSVEEAKDLAETINLGALPLKLKEMYMQRVGASLGMESFTSTVQASIVSVIIIIIFMIGYYRVPGIIASITIVAYIWLLITTMNLMGVTLTLPGIAAFVLAVGMAVDSNIITFERLKEEILAGKSLVSSLRAGSKTSFMTIMDANLTTIIAAAVLYQFGTGAIQGFALTLIVCITLSVVTNVFFSRLLLYYLIRSQVITNPVYYGVKESEIRAL